ncbi:MAG: hypothetical protein A3K90_04800 [Pelodictyon luteolum]|uniref:cellulase n=1 Tax=Pelodictyon luteolum TaxID=1100 RepID=A0A165LNL2_PELLU|nr:glycosyl hydrolase family 8 [Pelodictyon luteolum]KZK74237.1 MAG: hypothetical protein A3K90_04800 [Pelodictyon luteolum]
MMPRSRMLIVGFVAFSMIGLISCWPAETDDAIVLRKSWAGYLHTFVQEGRVVRPRNGFDTVSEGQAYAMIRAVTASDRTSFDAILLWTEKNLSRRELHGDNLLAWHYADGRVVDWQAASDADIDYAYSLLLAARKWGDPSYARLGRQVLADILRMETITYEGRLRLLPWNRKPTDGKGYVVQNPSYYSPAQFKLFFGETGDGRWLELAATGYDLLDRLQEPAGGGAFLVPDWCRIGEGGDLRELEGYSSLYGWDALRVPMRIALDHALFHEPRAARVLGRFAEFYTSEFKRFGHVHSVYSTGGRSVVYDENPLSYAAAYAALEASGSPLAETAYRRLQRFSHQKKGHIYYLDRKDYYANSLSWLPSYYRLLLNSENSSLQDR